MRRLASVPQHDVVRIPVGMFFTCSVHFVNELFKLQVNNSMCYNMCLYSDIGIKYNVMVNFMVNYDTGIRNQV